MDKLIGQILNDRYKIVDITGVGGMSVVYKARDLLENRYVAIKILKDEFLSDQKSRRRFLNESRAIAMLSHDNIVDVFDVNFEGATQYIVMEYIDGITLKTFMTEKHILPIDDAIKFTAQILVALEHAHERGVIHRDIKPHNIMLLDDESIKVADFGIAHVSNFDTVTMTDKAIGSVHYISPEQAKGAPTNAKSDIYSTGVILYEMLTGQLPFQSDSPVTVALMQVQQTPKNPTELNPTIPIGMEQIILKAMQKDPANRYENAMAMFKDLAKILADKTIEFNYKKIYNDNSTKVIDIYQNENNIDKPQKNEDVKNKKRNSWKWNVIRNRILAGFAGAFLAFILVAIGAGFMFTFVDKFAEQLVDVPSVVGRTILEVRADEKINKNFEIREENTYDDTVAAGIIIGQDPADGKFDKGKQLKVIVSKGKRMVTVPKITGLDEAQARVLIKEVDLYFDKILMPNDTQKEGIVLKTEPAVSTSVSVGTPIKVYISYRSEIQQVFVPDVVKKTKDAALADLFKQGLTADIIEEYNDVVKTGVVITQIPSADNIIDSGSSVTIIVSKGSISQAIAQGTYVEDLTSSGVDE